MGMSSTGSRQARRMGDSMRACRAWRSRRTRAQDVESVLDEQPAGIPALDIVVEDLELRGKKLGRIEIDAVNLGATAAAAARDMPREWRLNRFNISTPEASLVASGNWTNIAGQSPVVPGPQHQGTPPYRDEFQTRHQRLG
jgi:uncharacterized protein YhdP